MSAERIRKRAVHHSDAASEGLFNWWKVQGENSNDVGSEKECLREGWTWRPSRCDIPFHVEGYEKYASLVDRIGTEDKQTLYFWARRIGDALVLEYVVHILLFRYISFLLALASRIFPLPSQPGTDPSISTALPIRSARQLTSEDSAPAADTGQLDCRDDALFVHFKLQSTIERDSCPWNRTCECAISRCIRFTHVERRGTTILRQGLHCLIVPPTSPVRTVREISLRE